MSDRITWCLFWMLVIVEIIIAYNWSNRNQGVNVVRTVIMTGIPNLLFVASLQVFLEEKNQ